MSEKREDYISWGEYFMGVAILAARRSKDPNTHGGRSTRRTIPTMRNTFTRHTGS